MKEYSSRGFTGFGTATFLGVSFDDLFDFSDFSDLALLVDFDTYKGQDGGGGGGGRTSLLADFWLLSELFVFAGAAAGFFAGAATGFFSTSFFAGTALTGGGGFLAADDLADFFSAETDFFGFFTMSTLLFFFIESFSFRPIRRDGRRPSTTTTTRDTQNL